MRFPEFDRLDALALAALVARREATAAELVEAAIERIEARDPALNAVVHRWYEYARSAAAGPLPDGPFRGVPFLLKDLLAPAAGLPLTKGSRLWAGFEPGRDGEIVRRFKSAGLVLLGRTNCPELGLMGVTEPVLHGPCRNPWDPSRTPGGSSGGAAAAVAARIVPVAHGGDGGGSIRIPASHCGVFGLKPTGGRVSLGPDLGEAWGGFVQEHVLTRTVRDSAAMLDVLAGGVPGDPNPPAAPERPFRSEVGAPPGRLRVAFTARSLLGRETHPDCRAALESALGLMEDLGHDVEEVAAPIRREAMVRAYLVTVASETALELAAAEATTGVAPSRRNVEPPTRFLSALGRSLPAQALAEARRDVHQARRAMSELMSRFDVLVTPTAARPPVRVGELGLSLLERLAVELQSAVPVRRLIEASLLPLADASFEATPNTQVFNMTGQPAASVPLHWNGDGLPIGVQLAARLGDEATLFRLAAQLEAARPWASRIPRCAADHLAPAASSANTSFATRNASSAAGPPQ